MSCMVGLCKSDGQYHRQPLLGLWWELAVAKLARLLQPYPGSERPTSVGVRTSILHTVCTASKHEWQLYVMFRTTCTATHHQA